LSKGYCKFECRFIFFFVSFHTWTRDKPPPLKEDKPPPLKEYELKIINYEYNFFVLCYKYKI